MVELSTRKKEIWGDGGKHHEKLGLRRISCASQLTIPDTASMRPDPAPTNTIRGLPHPIRQVVPLISRICSYPPHRSHLHPPSLSFSFITLPSSQHTKSSHPSISPCHDHELTLSTAYTEYSIHWVQHTPSTASTEDCLCSLHSHDYELTPEWRFSFRRTSLHDRPSSANSPWEIKGKVTLSHSHGCELTNWWIECLHPGRRPLTASK